MNTQFFQGLRDFLPRRRLAQGWCLRLAAAACLTIFAMPSVLADPSTYRFGVVPQQAASRLVQMWAPLLHDVSAQTGVRLEFHTAPNIPEFERRLAAGEYDFAYMNPYHFVVFNRAPGYRALAHERDKRIQGIVVIHHESSLNDLSQLQGLKVCFPSPAAFAASLLPRAEMERRGIAIEAVSRFSGAVPCIPRMPLPCIRVWMQPWHNVYKSLWWIWRNTHRKRWKPRRWVLWWRQTMQLGMMCGC
jgi:hypothetical protein